MMNSCIYDELLYLTLPKRMFKNVFLLLRHYLEFFDFRNVVKQLRTSSTGSLEVNLMYANLSSEIASSQ